MPPSQENSIREQLARLGRELPAVILNKPELVDDELYLWKAFWELDSERYPAQGCVLHIPINSIFRYIRYNDIPMSYQARFQYCIRQLDMHYVSSTNARLKTK